MDRCRKIFFAGNFGRFVFSHPIGGNPPPARYTVRMTTNPAPLADFDPAHLAAYVAAQTASLLALPALLLTDGPSEEAPAYGEGSMDARLALLVEEDDYLSAWDDYDYDPREEYVDEDRMQDRADREVYGY